MNQHLPRIISDEERSGFFRDGVICLRSVFNDEWIELLNGRSSKESRTRRGLVQEFGIALMTAVFFFTIRITGSRFESMKNFVYKSPCAQIAAELLESETVNFFFEAVFRSFLWGDLSYPMAPG